MGVANAGDWAEAELDRATGEDDDDTCVVWPENAEAVSVFVRCTWTRTTLPDGGSVPTGIAAGEVRDVAELLGVPRAAWPQLLDDVRLMVGVVLPLLQSA